MKRCSLHCRFFLALVAPLVGSMLACAAAPAPKESLSIDLGGGLTMEFVLVRPGSFVREGGSQVTLTKPFYLAKTEVTQEQWEKLMGSNPSQFKGPKNPVEKVSWEDCQGFVEKLKGKAEGWVPALPTEAQWEYACRAGSTTTYCFGDAETGLGEYAWYSANSEQKTHPVGEKKANAWGLHDMHGNVWEWCADWYGAYPSGPETDPTGAQSGAARVDRGGSWGSGAVRCRSAVRHGDQPGIRGRILGFRPALVPSGG